MSEEEWVEDILDPDIYAVALTKARRIVSSMRRAWEYLTPVYERLESSVRTSVSKLKEPSRAYDVIAIDSTFSPTLSLRGLRAGFVLLAAITYPKPRRPIFRLRPVRSGFDEEEEPSSLPSIVAKREELKMMRDILAEMSEFDVLVRDGDFPPADAIFELRRRAKLTDLSHEVMKLAKERERGVVGLVKRISTSLIAYKFLGREFSEILDSAPDGVPKPVVSDLLSDPVVGWLLLDPGEFISVGKYGDDYAGSKFAVSYFSSMVKKEEYYTNRMSSVLERNPLFNEVEVGFYRPFARGSPVVKLTGFNLDLEDFASFSASCTKGPSYPDFINLADTACIEHARTLRPEMIMLDALKVASESEGLNKLRFRGRRADLVALQNVQKLHVFYRREG